MKMVGVGLLTGVLALAAATDVDLYSPQDLHARAQKLTEKGAPFASEQLQKYENSYTMLAYRGATGSSEVHEKEADVFFVVDGSATILLGGKLVNGRIEKPGELRGTSIEGGEKRTLTKGAVIHIPAGIPHQLLLEKGKPFTYFVVKVIGK